MIVNIGQKLEVVIMKGSRVEPFEGKFEERVEFLRKFKKKVHVGEMWKVQIVEINHSPRVFLVRPIKKIIKERLTCQLNTQTR